MSRDEKDELESVRVMCLEARGLFEQLMDVSIPQLQQDPLKMQGACLYASVLLLKLLSKFAAAQVRVMGGSAELEQGCKDPQGVWRGHYWVQGATRGGAEFLADITADQFGWPAVVVAEPFDEAWSRYRAGDHQEVQEAAWALEQELQAYAKPPSSR